jgi:hypothetical protein
VSPPRAADDFPVIRARMEELRRADDFRAIRARMEELRREPLWYRPRQGACSATHPRPCHRAARNG